MEKEIKPLILIVDDNPENIKVIGNVIRQLNYNSAYVNSGIKAIEFANKKQCDLIILDIMMPEMDGFSVCRSIKNVSGYKDIPIIFISALDDINSKLEGFKAGGVDYITKPFQIDEVSLRIKSHIEMRNMQKKLKEMNEELEERVKQRTHELHLAKERAEGANIAKTRFISSMSHELRTPLNSIIGFSEILMEQICKSDEERQVKYAKNINTSGKRLLSIIDDVLLYARLELGNDTINYSDINIVQLIRSCISSFSPAFNEKNIAVSTSQDESLTEGKFQCDDVKISQIIFCILDNAVKFTPNGGAVSVAVMKENGMIVVKVTDTGKGISKEELENIFISFYQIGKGFDDKNPGSGLGLTIARHLAENLCGSLTSESEGAGKGASFTLRLPC